MRLIWTPDRLKRQGVNALTKLQAVLYLQNKSFNTLTLVLKGEESEDLLRGILSQAPASLVMSLYSSDFSTAKSYYSATQGHVDNGTKTLERLVTSELYSRSKLDSSFALDAMSSTLRSDKFINLLGNVVPEEVPKVMERLANYALEASQEHTVAFMKQIGTKMCDNLAPQTIKVVLEQVYAYPDKGSWSFPHYQFNHCMNYMITTHRDYLPEFTYQHGMEQLHKEVAENGVAKYALERILVEAKISSGVLEDA